LRSA
jgi:hypothetical protein